MQLPPCFSLCACVPRIYRCGCILLCLGLLACAAGPQLPKLNGKAAIVLGYSTEDSSLYEGGMLYTGLSIDELDGNPITPLGKYDFLMLEPGDHRLGGHCYWRLRSVFAFEPDWREPATLALHLEADRIYTLHVSVDEYKFRCNLSALEERPESR
ncbi:hypothetical protein [Shewanella salipaludis]|uniref:DUF2846 domain-containing protein n=1 Tax=Shewanella salipaludis TaxID=2723052 RepID=A0A972JKG6_9GAMM|nr:hypothetical protein [Shewanella salipaludis]NMH67133.1 hypothetical protein [Shewanella salipaludis]